MSKKIYYIYFKLTQAFCKCRQKIQNHEQIYMELKNIKQRNIKQVKVYYEHI